MRRFPVIVSSEINKWMDDRGLIVNSDWGWSLFNGIWIDKDEDAAAFKLAFNLKNDYTDI